MALMNSEPGTSAAFRGGAIDVSKSPFSRLRTLPLSAVRLSGGLWSARTETSRQVSLEHGRVQLEESGTLPALRVAAGISTEPLRGLLFRDSDAYKWLEAVAHTTATRDEPVFERHAHEIAGWLTRAQQADGYLNTFYQLEKPEQRWRDLAGGHEMYCAGHLMQAAVAEQRARGSGELLRVATRFAEHLGSTFGPGRRQGVCGHPEIETALIELYRTTGNPSELELARYFIDARGHGLLGRCEWFLGGNAEYFQDHAPVREARTMVGHAVRQLYLSAGVADLYLETGERALLDALLAQWEDLTERKLYVTGGIGARHHGEAFGNPHELPNESAYAETCASIAGVHLAFRLLLASGEARFADALERMLYNTVGSGIGLDGKTWFYQNPLASHAGQERPHWFGCACCPPNAMRLLASLGQYLATESSEGLELQLYTDATIEGRDFGLRVDTRYPWDGEIDVHVTRAPARVRRLSLRVPGWCEQARLTLNGAPLALSPGQSAGVSVESGYIRVEREFHAGDQLRLTLEMPARLTEGHPRVEGTRGAVAVERGPLVYAAEGVDQSGAHPYDLILDTSGSLDLEPTTDRLGGSVMLRARGWLSGDPGSLYRTHSKAQASRRRRELKLIPYFARANRGKSPFSVWLSRG